MFVKQRMIAVSALFLLFVSFSVPTAGAKGNEFDAVCDRLEDKFKAKKVKIPFMWIARFAVGIVRPAGVKSFKVTTYTDLKFSRESLDREMRQVMTEAFSEDWSPILRIRSKTGEHVYMNMRQAGKSIKLLIVSIGQQEATVVRATFNPEKLSDFLDDPKIFGFSLNDSGKSAKSGEAELNEKTVEIGAKELNDEN